MAFAGIAALAASYQAYLSRALVEETRLAIYVEREMSICADMVASTYEYGRHIDTFVRMGRSDGKYGTKSLNIEAEKIHSSFIALDKAINDYKLRSSRADRPAALTLEQTVRKGSGVTHLTTDAADLDKLDNFTTSIGKAVRAFQIDCAGIREEWEKL